MKHTRQAHTPFKIMDSERDGAMLGTDLWIVDSKGELIAELSSITSPEHIELMEFHASFIVRAVNSHEELLEACIKASQYLHKYHALGLVYADGIIAMEKCDKAIQKTEGEV